MVRVRVTITGGVLRVRWRRVWATGGGWLHEWRLDVREEWRRLRPGLAPEVAAGWSVCPWLTRTAGRHVFRPDAWDLLLRRQAAAFESLGQTISTAMQPALHAAMAACEAFSQAWVKLSQTAVSTAGRSAAQ